MSAVVTFETRHCDTCECWDMGSLGNFNRRCARLLADHPLDLLMIPQERLATSPKFRFGFRPFLASQENTKLVAIFLAAIVPYAREEGWSDEQQEAWHAQSRYFGVVIPAKWDRPTAFEYKARDIFNINSAAPVYGEDIESLMALSDAALFSWLNRSRVALRDYVIEACGF